MRTQVLKIATRSKGVSPQDAGALDVMAQEARFRARLFELP